MKKSILAFLILCTCILGFGCAVFDNDLEDGVNLPPPVINVSEFDLSIGNLKLGYNVPEMTEALKKLGQSYDSRDLKSKYSAKYKYGDFYIDVTDGYITSISFYGNSKISTEKDIHPKSTIREMIDAYGDTCAFSVDTTGNIVYSYTYLFSSDKGSTAALEFSAKDEKIYRINLKLIDEATKEKFLSNMIVLGEDEINTTAYEEKTLKEYLLRVKPLFEKLNSQWKMTPNFNTPTDNPAFRKALIAHVQNGLEIAKYDIVLLENLQTSLKSMNPPPSANEFLRNESRILEIFQDTYKLLENRLDDIKNKERDLDYILQTLKQGNAAINKRESLEKLVENRHSYFQKFGIPVYE